MAARDTLTQALMETMAAPRWMADEWLDAYRAEVLSEAAAKIRDYRDRSARLNPNHDAAWAVEQSIHTIAADLIDPSKES